MRLWHLGLLLFSAPLAGPAAAQQPAVVPVGTVQAERQAVTQGSSFVGRLQAVQRVELRARVTGFLEQVAFTEGEVVTAGTELFRIEQAPFAAAVHGAEAALQRAQAAHRNAALQRQRAEELVRTNAIPVATRDLRVAEEAMTQANVTSAQAALESSRIDLGYTIITAPVTGRIGRSALTQGNVVSPESGVLALLVSQDPMYVNFPVSQRQLLEIQRKRQGGQDGGAAVRRIRLRFSDGSDYGQVGRINFVDVTVDRATDTVMVRGNIANPNGLLVDGQYVTVMVEEDQPLERVVIPQAALIADQEGIYVLLVKDGKAAVQRVRTGPIQGARAVIEQGLQGGELVIVEGIQRVRPGQAVQASPVQRIDQGS